jgi:hypothetical protein
MSVRDTLTNSIAGLLLERPVSGLSLEEMAETLELNGRKLERQFAATADTAKNRSVVSHIAGIERWGQSRLQVALGEPLSMDEYDDYRPAREANWASLQDAFQETRQQTVALARRLAAANVDAVQVPHNQFGPLSMRGWLRYLDIHANLEAKKLR